MKHTFFLILFIIYVLVTAAWSYREILKLKAKSIGERERIKLYKATILEEGFFVLIIVLAANLTGMTAYDLGIAPVGITLKHYNSWLTASTLGISGVLLMLVLYQMVCYLVSEDYRKQVVDTLNRQKAKESHYARVLSEIMLPKSSREKQWFTVLSVAAGTCEELIYRGFLFYLFSNIFTELPVGLFPILGGAVFGIAHSYQGVMGCFKTGLLGILFGALYVATGSLLPGMLLHFMVDFSSNFLFQTETEEGVL